MVCDLPNTALDSMVDCAKSGQACGRGGRELPVPGMIALRLLLYEATLISASLNKLR